MKKPPTKLSEAVCAKALARLSRQAKHGDQSLSQLARAMGKNPGYLSTAEGPHLSRIVDGAHVAGLNLRAFFEGIFVDRRLDPRELLHLERDPVRYLRDPFLLACDGALGEIATRVVERTHQRAIWRPMLEQIEDRRYRDREGARKEFETFIRMRLREIDPSTNSVPSHWLADIAAAFTGWAATQRMKGQRDEAADGLEIAFTLARRSRDRWALGICYHRAVLLIREYGRPDVGLDWVDEASSCFLISGDLVEQQQLLVERGLMLVELGDLEEGRETIDAALVCLPASRFRFIAAAYHALAMIAQRQDNLPAALGHLETALACYPRPDYAYAFVLWQQGSAELALGWDTQAIVTLRRGLQFLKEFGSQFDVAKLAITIAEIMIHRERPEELATFAADLSPWVAELQGRTALREQLEDLLAMIEMGELSADGLERIRGAVETASTTRRRPY
jgi:tetratricopeptide (TPR) repeat protein